MRLRNTCFCGPALFIKNEVHFITQQFYNGNKYSKAFVTLTIFCQP